MTEKVNDPKDEASDVFLAPIELEDTTHGGVLRISRTDQNDFHRV